MKKFLIICFLLVLSLLLFIGAQPDSESEKTEEESIVYFTKDISPDGLMKVFEKIEIS